MYDERFKDIVATKIIEFSNGDLQISGRDLYGKKVWILIHCVHCDHVIKQPATSDPETWDAPPRQSALS